MKSFIVKFLATFGGSGLAPFAPGTFGSLAGLVFCWLFSLARQPSIQFLFQILFLIIFIPLGVVVSSKYEKITGKHDPKEVVIDEVVGMVITLFSLPFSLFNIVVGFALFRFFDILKPFPIGKLQNIKGGWGIMADDIAAGFVSLAVLKIISCII